jgi:hypothetical protein
MAIKGRKNREIISEGVISSQMSDQQEVHTLREMTPDPDGEGSKESEIQLPVIIDAIPPPAEPNPVAPVHRWKRVLVAMSVQITSNDKLTHSLVMVFARAITLWSP